jgi:hypothetical protein
MAFEDNLRLRRIDTSFRVLDYPGIAMILFLIAAAAGLWLGYDIVGADRAHGRRS